MPKSNQPSPRRVDEKFLLYGMDRKRAGEQVTLRSVAVGAGKAGALGLSLDALRDYTEIERMGHIHDCAK